MDPVSFSEHSSRPGASHLFLRALLAFVACPGMVAYAVPALVVLFGTATGARHLAGLALLVPGTILLLWCVRDFYVAGRGTLAPWTPPEKLVVVGLYRYSRNPMYVAVALVLLGWAATFGSATLLVYALCVVTAFHLRVVFGEEPWLARRHGAAWHEYCARVPRWLF